MELEHIENSEVELILQKSKAVKFISFFDIMVSLLYLFFVPFYGFAGLFCLLFSILGFYGAKNLNKCHILSYFLYLLFQNIYRLSLFLLIIIYPSYFNISNISASSIITNSILIIFNFYSGFLE